MALLFTDYFQKQFKAQALSKTALIFYFFMALAFIMPLVLVIKTHRKQLKAGFMVSM